MCPLAEFLTRLGHMWEWAAFIFHLPVQDKREEDEMGRCFLHLQTFEEESKLTLYCSRG